VSTEIENHFEHIADTLAETLVSLHSMRESFAQLERENAELRAESKLLNAAQKISEETDGAIIRDVLSLRTKVTELERENAALKADKDRLDWIQTNGPRIVNVLHHWQVWDNEEFRAVVDSVRAKEGGAT